MLGAGRILVKASREGAGGVCRGGVACVTRVVWTGVCDGWQVCRIKDWFVGCRVAVVMGGGGGGACLWQWGVMIAGRAVQA